MAHFFKTIGHRFANILYRDSLTTHTQFLGSRTCFGNYQPTYDIYRYQCTVTTNKND